jgi:hypothetical protein
MGKIAAMKILRRDLASDKEVVKRFRREAEAISKLTHPNTVQIFDFGAYEGALYLVMEYVRGEDMGVLLGRDGPIPVRRAGPMFVQICGALEEAHELGIVHRDLKPENVIVTRTKDGSDHCKVLDFGLAKLSEREDVDEGSGREAIVGTPYYMAPEQIRGEPLDHRADIYALGAMMYRVLCGEPPFSAATPVGVLTKHLTDELTPLHLRVPELHLDPRLSDIVARAMAKPRDARYRTVGEMREDLIGFVNELSASMLRTTPLPESVPSRATGRHTPLPATPSERRASVIEEETRLQRHDIDAYERQLRRRAMLRLFVPPVLVAGLAVGGYFGWQYWMARPQTSEREPNGQTAGATLLAIGQDVTGLIGQRQSDTLGDVDVYRAQVPAGLPGPVRLHARVSGIRNIDLELALIDAAGRELAVADAGGTGAGEAIDLQEVRDQTAFVVVRESRQDPQTGGLSPTENVSDRYTLRVELGPFAPGDEREPNDSAPEASGLDSGVGRGLLARPRDIDQWRWEGPAGKATISLSGAEGAPFKLRIGSGQATGQREVTASLDPGTIISVERADPEGTPPKPLPGAAAAYELRVAATASR